MCTLSPSLNPLSCCFCSWAWLTFAAAASWTHLGPSVCSAGCRASAGCRRVVAGPMRRSSGRGCFQPSGSCGWSCLLRGDTAPSPGWRRRRRRRPASSVDWAVVDACHPPTANRPIRNRKGEEVNKYKVTFYHWSNFPTATSQHLLPLSPPLPFTGFRQERAEWCSRTFKASADWSKVARGGSRGREAEKVLV